MEALFYVFEKVIFRSENTFGKRKKNIVTMIGHMTHYRIIHLEQEEDRGRKQTPQIQILQFPIGVHGRSFEYITKML